MSNEDSSESTKRTCEEITKINLKECCVIIRIENCRWDLPVFKCSCTYLRFFLLGVWFGVRLLSVFVFCVCLARVLRCLPVLSLSSAVGKLFWGLIILVGFVVISVVLGCFWFGFSLLCVFWWFGSWFVMVVFGFCLYGSLWWFLCEGVRFEFCGVFLFLDFWFSVIEWLFFFVGLRFFVFWVYTLFAGAGEFVLLCFLCFCV